MVLEKKVLKLTLIYVWGSVIKADKKYINDVNTV